MKNETTIITVRYELTFLNIVYLETFLKLIRKATIKPHQCVLLASVFKTALNNATDHSVLLTATQCKLLCKISRNELKALEGKNGQKQVAMSETLQSAIEVICFNNKAA
jgi:hypothetical protein